MPEACRSATSSLRVVPRASVSRIMGVRRQPSPILAKCALKSCSPRFMAISVSTSNPESLSPTDETIPTGTGPPKLPRVQTAGVSDS